MDIGYAHQKLERAVRSLAISADPLDERLRGAVTHHLHGFSAERHLPEPHRAKYADLLARIEKVASLSHSEQEKVAEEFWELFSEIEQQYRVPR